MIGNGKRRAEPRKEDRARRKTTKREVFYPATQLLGKKLGEQRVIRQALSQREQLGEKFLGLVIDKRIKTFQQRR